MSSSTVQFGTLVEQVAGELSLKIDRREWPAGRRLPSVRKLAKQFEVSPCTVHSAVQLLARRGVVRPRSRSGVYVEGKRQTVAANQIGIIWNGRQPDSRFTFDMDDWMARILRSAQEDLHGAGYFTTMLGYVDPSKPSDRIETIRPSLGGILTFALPGMRPLLDKLDQWNLPWITINPHDRRAVHNFVAADNVGDCARLGQCLARSGLLRVWVVTCGLTESDSSMEKLLGLYEGFNLAGVSTQGIEVLDCGSVDEPVGYEAAIRRLSDSPPPQVVFAGGDMLALGVLRACRERALRVPEDIAVIGATGLRLGALSHPMLSTVAQPMEEMGRQAAQMLVEMAREGTRRMIGRRISGELIVRESFVPAEGQFQQFQAPPDVPAAETV